MKDTTNQIEEAEAEPEAEPEAEVEAEPEAEAEAEEKNDFVSIDLYDICDNNNSREGCITEIKKPHKYHFFDKKHNIKKMNSDKHVYLIDILYFIYVLSTEIFWVFACCLLMLFIPQSCEDKFEFSIIKICVNQLNNGNIDNSPMSVMSYYATSFNFLTLFAFMGFYGLQMLREKYLLNYLDTNVENLSDETTIIESLRLLPEDKKTKLESIDYKFRNYGKIIIAIYCLNIIFSFSVICKFPANLTFTTFVGYMLFMIGKLRDIYDVTHADKHIYYSSYFQKYIMYNDIDYRYKKSNKLNSLESS
jgi:hypothetical protein